MSVGRDASRLNLLRLAWRYLWARPWLSALNLLLLSLGLAAVAFVLLVSEQLERGLRRDLAGIDLVVGAKGSPMQILLAGVFHLDQSTGNIPLATWRQLRAQPLVAQAVPISLGDSLGGFRIVGSTPDYLQLYQLSLAQGRAWDRPMQALLGAEVARRTGLRVGDRFQGSHGLGAGGQAHEQAYEVVGLLAPSGSVADRLVLTDLASVWEAHAAHGHGQSAQAGEAGQEDHDEHEHEHGGRLAQPNADPLAQPDAGREISMLLLRYRSPLAAAMLPRWVNAQPGLQASVPALETARLLSMLGVGVEVLRGFGVVLLLAAALSVLVALLHALRERQSDLAMLRMLGASPARVATLLLVEAGLLAGLASALGLVLAHGLVGVLGWALSAQQSLRLSATWVSPWELAVPALALGLAGLAAAWPARRAYRLDVTELLQRPH
jgi:putative ABC transport system permease protein